MAIVSIKSQQVTFYDADGWILRAPVSTGVKGRETPAGVFAVIEKDKDHRSTMYDDAWMPNMQRITWNGLALHGGPLPGYAASHGCVRMPYGFAEEMFDKTRIGMRVIVSPNDAAPVEFSHPALFVPNAEAIAAAPARAETLAREAAEAARGGRRSEEGCRHSGARGRIAHRIGAQARAAEDPRRRQAGRRRQGDRRCWSSKGAGRGPEAEGRCQGRGTGGEDRRRQDRRDAEARRRRSRKERCNRRRGEESCRAKRRARPHRSSRWCASWNCTRPAPTPSWPPPTRRSPPRIKAKARAEEAKQKAVTEAAELATQLDTARIDAKSKLDAAAAAKVATEEVNARKDAAAKAASEAKLEARAGLCLHQPRDPENLRAAQHTRAGGRTAARCSMRPSRFRSRSAIPKRRSARMCSPQ